MASEQSGGYFKKYARDQRIQTTEEVFNKGVKFEQTPLDTGEHKIVLNYDMLNDGRVITPRRGLRTIRVALPLTTPDLYSKITEDILLTDNLDAVEEDNTHYSLYIANQCTEGTVGIHSGPAEMWVVDKDIDKTFDILEEYNITTRDMYAIPISYEIDSIKSGLFSELMEYFIKLEQIDYNADVKDGVFSIDPAYKGGVVFKTLTHPFELTIAETTGDFVLYEAVAVDNKWQPKEDTAVELTPGTYSFAARTVYYILPKNGAAELPAKDPYISVSTTTEDAEVEYQKDKIEVGTKTFTYHEGTVSVVVNSIGVTATVDVEKFFEKIKEEGEHTFTYLLNTIEYATTVPGATIEIDRTEYNRIQPNAGVASFVYITNISDSITCSTTNASIELDIHRFNRKVLEAGTTTFTYSNTDKAWKLDGTIVSLPEYGIKFKDPNGSLANSDTIKIVTKAKNKWQLDDNYVTLTDYGITYTQGETAPKDGDVINVKSVVAGTWLYKEEYVKAIDYGIDVTDPSDHLIDGDTMVLTASKPTSWMLGDTAVDLAEQGIIFSDPKDLVKDGDTITVTRTALSAQTISFGQADHEYPGSMYYIPADAVGNGYPLSNNRAAKAIGCFAWNNNYYNFNSHGELIRTRYQVTTEDVTKTYYTEAMSPKEIKTSEAISAGFNMLLEDPYMFTDAFEEGSISLEGILLYDASDRLISEPVLNTPYKLRCFYTVERGTRYKIKWDYRSISSTTWTDIDEEEFIYKESDEKPHELKILSFSSPIEDCVLRVQAFKWDKSPVISYATSVANASVILNELTIEEMFPESGTFSFSYDGTTWKYLGKSVLLSTYGITFSDITNGLKAGSTLRITVEYKEEYSETAEHAVSMSLRYVKTPSTATANKELKNYDLSRCTGMLFWKSRIWLYGLPEDPTVLFASDINEPTYFPYPNNIDIFDEPIMHCAAFNENMLVFTRSGLYKLTLNDAGYWTKTVIQGDLNFTEFDTNTIKIVKNMVFFKSGDYYYMVVPKTLSLQNELAIAPVSRNIEKFLDNFTVHVPELFDLAYEYTGTLELVAHYNFLNYEDVHNVYTFLTESGLLLNLVLLYNTVDRHWRFYTYESQELYRPVRQDATKTSDIYAPLHCFFNKNGEMIPRLGVQVIQHEENSIKDFYIPSDAVFTYLDDTWQKDNGVIENKYKQQHTFKNWTVLDCGYRNIITDYKKRCRELQFKFNNSSGANLRFLTEFILDGETRKSYYRYETEHVIDPADPNYGFLYVSRTPVENMDIPGTTILAEDATDLNSWTLDYSRFPEIAFAKARFKVSGKGYTPRFRLLSRSEEDYELIGYTWVYRAMYSR